MNPKTMSNVGAKCGSALRGVFSKRVTVIVGSICILETLWKRGNGRIITVQVNSAYSAALIGVCSV